MSKPKLKPEILFVRMSKSERVAWSDAALRDGRTLSSWVRRQLNLSVGLALSADDRDVEQEPAQ